MHTISDHAFAGAVLDALTAHICVVNLEGNIVAENESWRRFAGKNGGYRTFVGTNYIDVCMTAQGSNSESAARFGKALRDVLTGKRQRYRAEYPCHSPTRQRWFLGTVTPLLEPGNRGERSTVKGAVVSHFDITARRLLQRRFKKLSETDELTGLHNRRKFFSKVLDAWKVLKLRGKPASVVLADLDNFKNINDTFGHDAGDQALRFAAGQLRQALRRRDVLARIGGEEFAILLPSTDEWGAVMLAERMRKLIAAAPVEAGSASFPIAASFGVAMISPYDVDAVAAVARADKALYRAKIEGRNRVRVYADPIVQESAMAIGLGSGC
ncbi:diguanylate cyclase (GGDEF) domain-containing protein [Filomicrobium insigne]|uniref:diguanylate cyclase n=1 Tax=Filomicrobium insigne TaxID=418854 RepID=A0A1H0JNV1_9HYPH|nr:sensor domain-containing diguanylate cyclase [Filomicrobium insigne]SDO45406.1 diguanylate cyclase (GGDEF) domain-containing protein [Filomicrobium insigne]